jgi:hypothetical protein
VGRPLHHGFALAPLVAGAFTRHRLAHHHLCGKYRSGHISKDSRIGWKTDAARFNESAVKAGTP